MVAFNVITLEHAEGVAEGAERAGYPVIMQLSENAIRYHGGDPAPIGGAMVAVARASRAAIALHLDHITDLELLARAEELGFASAMYDGSTLEFGENAARTRAAARWGKEHGVWIEAELGEVGGKAGRGAHAPGVRTDPDEAARFVAETGVDALAVAVGSQHAMVERTARVDHDLVERLHSAVPVPLVLHGSSGLPDDEIVEATRRGITKVNIGTALNVAYTGAIRRWLDSNTAGVDPRKYTTEARSAVADVVEHYLKVVAAPVDHGSGKMDSDTDIHGRRPS
ncbi:MAG TPA: class II fructose-bisphosphate aldolase [Actinomycetaceae bacterium]|nr:class II fructose-bisphosphate aldolase [Actinomycetaceae bacterium]